MRTINDEEMNSIFQSATLMDKFRNLYKEWTDMLEKVRKGEMSLEETKLKYDEYSAAVEEWDKYRNNVVLFDRAKS